MKKRIAIDLGGTHLRIGVVQDNKLMSYVKKNTPKEKKELLDELSNTISEYFNKSFEGIGVACPGPLENGIIKNTPNLPIKNFNLKGFLQNKFKTKIEIENDAKCVALAELKLGCRKKNFFILTLGTGIGGGIIINGKLYKGKGYAGELGHILLEKEKDMEKLWQSYRELSTKYFGRVVLAKELLKMKTKKSEEILFGMSDVLGRGISTLSNIFDPEIVVLAGGISETRGRFLNLVKRDVKKYLFLPRKLDLKWTTLKHPGVLGASLLLDKDN